MIGDLAAALDAWEHDTDVDVVLLDGAGERGLCAGGDVRGLAERVTEGRAEDTARVLPRRVRAERAASPSTRSPSSRSPTASRWAAGIGLAGHAAIRIVTERSKLAMPETRIGFTPDVGGTWLLAHAPGSPRRVPRAHGRGDGRARTRSTPASPTTSCPRTGSRRCATRSRRAPIRPARPSSCCCSTRRPEPSRLDARPRLDRRRVRRGHGRRDRGAAARAARARGIRHRRPARRAVAHRPRRDARRRAALARARRACATRSSRSTGS